ncbi:hypothetical protein [Sphingomonas sp.]|uniref:hypothetical protein n=1 Tax=Sphingomonas sp. TaxID=28214 RepID=UPI001B007D7D|nr:hypothetical protein [Sphingomonas sp.]MBO9715007.1 hypothetical protein [Sphingomonas sp.]
MHRTAAAQRYLRRFTPMMIAYVVVLFAATWAIEAYKPHGAALVALSVLPALPIIGVIAVIGLYLAEETDEFLRQRIVACQLFGVGVLLSASTVLGFLQIGGVIGKVDVFWGFPLWCAAWGLAQCALSLRDQYRGGEA